MDKSEIERLRKGIEGLVGFGAVSKLGGKLNEGEIEAISAYVGARGGSREYVASVLKQNGRPFAVDDYTFQEKCHVCRELRNYCCC